MPSGSIVIVQGSATTGPKLATLDMEGLDKFTAYVSQVRVAAENGGSSTPWYNRPNATLILAKTNFISATGSPGLWLSRNSGNGGIGEAKLGQTNAIFCYAGITVGDRKSDANTKLYFNPSFSSPSALFRNLAGTGRQTQWIIGDQSGQTSGGTTAGGTVDFSGGTVDAQVGTILVARGAGTGGTGAGTGTLTFGAGVLDVNTLDIGTQVGGPGVGTVNVNNSALLVVNTALRLTPAGGASSATLNVNGGTARINTITSGGGGTVAVNLTGGTLVLTNTAGSLAFPILNLLAADATFTLGVANQYVPVVNFGWALVAAVPSVSM